MSPIILLLLLTWMQNPHPKRKAKLAQDPKTHMLRLRFANMVSTTCPFKDSWTGGIATSTPTFSEQVPILRLPAPLCGPCLCHPPSHLGFHLEKTRKFHWENRHQSIKSLVVGGVDISAPWGTQRIFPDAANPSDIGVLFGGSDF